jgi:hypothetical protein
MIFSSLSRLLNEKKIGGDLASLLDHESSLVIGVDSHKNVFLAGPQIEGLVAFSHEAGKLENNKSIFLHNAERIEPVFKLQCKVSDTDHLWAISSVFFGLSNLFKRRVTSDSFVSAFKGVEEFFQREKDHGRFDVAEIGLFGELVFLLNHKNCDVALLAWHESKFENYDFSYSGLQVEIKTTTQTQRLHRLKSTQSLLNSTNPFFYVSVYAARMHGGITVHGLIEAITERISPNLRMEFKSRLDQFDLSNFKKEFDLDRARKSIHWYSDANVPKPIVSDDRILEVGWLCDFDRINPEAQPAAWLS